MSVVPLVLLIDADPPSDVGGGRGFYPAAPPGAPGLDRQVIESRFDAIDRFAAGLGDKAVVTVHTSPRFRDDLLQAPYLDRWRTLQDRGVVLALHPHEDRVDGTTLYEDLGHLAVVFDHVLSRAAASGLALDAFRSGGFAFHPSLPDMMARSGIRLDLSAAPGLTASARSAAWAPETAERSQLAGPAGGVVGSVPLGWNGTGRDLGRDYLFNERLDFAGLAAVWDAIRRRADTLGQAPAVNFLAHGFGLADAGWRSQALRFIRHAEAHGGQLSDPLRFATPVLETSL